MNTFSALQPPEFFKVFMLIELMSEQEIGKGITMKMRAYAEATIGSNSCATFW